MRPRGSRLTDLWQLQPRSQSHTLAVSCRQWALRTASRALRLERAGGGAGMGGPGLGGLARPAPPGRSHVAFGPAALPSSRPSPSSICRVQESI